MGLGVLAASVIGSSVLGGFQQKNASKAAFNASQADWENITKVFGQQSQPILGAGGTLGQGFGKQGQELQGVVGGFDQIKGMISGLGGAARDRVEASGRESVTQALQQGSRTGLYNSSQAANAMLGATAQSQRVMRELDEGLIGMQMQASQGQLAAQTNLANFYGTSAAATANMQSTLAGFYTNKQNIAGPPLDLSGMTNSLIGLSILNSSGALGGGSLAGGGASGAAGYGAGLGFF